MVAERLCILKEMANLWSWIDWTDQNPPPVNYTSEWSGIT